VGPETERQVPVAPAVEDGVVGTVERARVAVRRAVDDRHRRALVELHPPSSTGRVVTRARCWMGE
jgi:hypothetical protein